MPKTLDGSFLRLRPLGFKDILPFGKYVNKTVRWVVDNNYQYILWLRDSTPIKFTKAVINQCERDLSDDYYFYLEDDWGDR